MFYSIRKVMALTATSLGILAISMYLPWMVPNPAATRIPDIGLITRGFRFDEVEILVLVVATVASGFAFTVPSDLSKGGLLFALGLSYAVLPHFLIVYPNAGWVFQKFAPTFAGPALATVAGCLAVAAGTAVICMQDADSLHELFG